MFQYRVCGLSVVSDFTLTGMAPANGDDSQAEVRVRYGTTPAALTAARHAAGNWQLDSSAFLLEVPQVARFLVTDGCEVVVDLHPASTEADAMPFLLGTAFGVLLHQRGQLVLHAATVTYKGKGIALCGASGAGKSTLAAALCQAGCNFVGDDVAAIRFDECGTPLIMPDGRQHRLWADAVDQLALTDRLGLPVRPYIKKFHIDPTTADTARPTPLSAIFILREATAPHQFELTPLEHADAAPLIRGEVYRSSLARHLGRNAELFRQIAALLVRVRTFRLDRPMDFAVLKDTIPAILSQVGEDA